MKIDQDNLSKLVAGKTVHINGHMLVPINHNPHECRADGFHPARIGAKKAPDGKWYVEDGARKGKWLRVRHGD